MKTSTIRQACQDSIKLNKPFPEVLAVLAEAGVERYHADLTQRRKTYYDAKGNAFSCELEIEPLGEAPYPGDPGEVKAAIRAIQQRQSGYVDFLRRIVRAGVTDYFVFLAGRKAVYVDRHGDSHVEMFPQ